MRCRSICDNFVFDQVKVLKGLSDKGRLAGSAVDVLALKQPLRGVQCLHDLLVRLDLGGWWQKN